MNSLLTVEGLTVRYGEATAIDDISIDVPPGHIVAVVGPNGAGKTTLFRTVFGEYPKSAGSVTLCGLDPFDVRQRRDIWRKARWVRDTAVLYEELTVREFLEFTARAYGVPESAIPTQIESKVRAVGLWDRFNSRIKQLSFGMQRKVHVIAGFLAGTLGPQLVALDEPMVGLDPPSRLNLRDFLMAYVRPEGRPSERSLLISSHNLPELSQMADYLLMMTAGKIIAAGPVRELLNSVDRSLRFEIVLFEGSTERLSALLLNELDIDCDEVHESHVVIECRNRSQVSDVFNLLSREQQQFPVREFREQFSGLEQLFDGALVSHEAAGEEH